MAWGPGAGLAYGPMRVPSRRTRHRPGTARHRALGAAYDAPSPGRLEDSVFTVLDVDTAVVRSITAPRRPIPLKLLQAHSWGRSLRSTSSTRPGSPTQRRFIVLSATHPEFAQRSGRRCRHRFQPAEDRATQGPSAGGAAVQLQINDTSIVAPPRIKTTVVARRPRALLD